MTRSENSQKSWLGEPSPFLNLCHALANLHTKWNHTDSALSTAGLLITLKESVNICLFCFPCLSSSPHKYGKCWPSYNWQPVGLLTVLINVLWLTSLWIPPFQTHFSRSDFMVPSEYESPKLSLPLLELNMQKGFYICTPWATYMFLMRFSLLSCMAEHSTLSDLL